jgi:hypothetical protein
LSAIDWIFDPVPASGAIHGGLAQAQVFPNDVDSFVREVLQNARDQRVSQHEPVRVRFLLEELEGPDLEAFLTGVAWDRLRPHLDAVADAEQITISPRIRANLQRLDSGGRMRVMRIDDQGTNGLTGDEDEADSNFNALCRHTLVTSGGRRDSGGSFGLGKSVLWRFSGFSTVLFASTLVEPAGAERYFGRTLLTYHRADSGEWEGSGWLGEREERPNGYRAISVWGSEARQLSSGSRLARQTADTGTSIMVIGFDDPTREEDPDVPELCGEIARSTARWFWPAMLSDQIDVTVEGRVGGEAVYFGTADITDEVRPFVKAHQASVEGSGRIADPGEVAEQSVRLTVPAQRPEQVEQPLPRAEASGCLRIRLAESGEADWANTVALHRGAGMVVQYYAPRRRTIAEQTFHGTLAMGTAHGDADSDRAAEQFLRAAEPVAHSAWVGTTDRVHAEYFVGAQKALRALEDGIAEAVADMMNEPTADSSRGPDALRRLFPLPGIGGGSVTREPFRLTDGFGSLTGSLWTFGGRYSRAGDPDHEWRFRIALELDQEDGSAGERLPITAVEVDAGDPIGPAGDGSWLVRVPPEVSTVRFRGTAARPADIPPTGLGRARVRLDVRPSLAPTQ